MYSIRHPILKKSNGQPMNKNSNGQPKPYIRRHSQTPKSQEGLVGATTDPTNFSVACPISGKKLLDKFAGKAWLYQTPYANRGGFDIQFQDNFTNKLAVIEVPRAASKQEFYINSSQKIKLNMETFNKFYEDIENDEVEIFLYGLKDWFGEEVV
eukprot:GHVP01013348.1.p1 GENE.GHVP01013348.1~~GHVP01013348.1.p1  ORF type:complete len:154 (+),score=25.68 GHVP01013348.1:291-752(+)